MLRFTFVREGHPVLVRDVGTAKVKVKISEIAYYSKVVVRHLVSRSVVAAPIARYEMPGLHHDRPDEAGVGQVVHCKRSVAITRVVELARAIHPRWPSVRRPVIRSGPISGRSTSFDRLPSHGYPPRMELAYGSW